MDELMKTLELGDMRVSFLRKSHSRLVFIGWSLSYFYENSGCFFFMLIICCSSNMLSIFFSQSSGK
jgi:hypothetical protein